MTVSHSRYAWCVLLSLALAGGVVQAASDPDAYLDVTVEGDSRVPGLLSTEGSRFDTDYTVEPSNTSGSPATRKTNRLRLNFGCRHGGGYLTGCLVSLFVDSRAGTGGHVHSSDRPTGSFTRLFGTVDPHTGLLETVFTAPEASGIITIYGEAFHPLTFVRSEEFTIGVGFEGLVELPDSDQYLKIGSRPEHPDNHFGTSTLVTRMQELAVAYREAYPDATPLEYNDMSLEFGGVFDLNKNWAPPHRGHRTGVHVDLRTRTIPDSALRELRLLAPKFGLKVFDETKTPNPHFHLTSSE